MKNLIMSVLPMFAIQTFADSTTQHIEVKVTSEGFVPSTLNVAPGTDVTLDVTRLTDSTCSTEIQVPALKIKNTVLPLNKTVSVHLGKLDKGEIKFGCGMNMMDGGRISVK